MRPWSTSNDPMRALDRTLADIVRFGSVQALLELVRQGAPRQILADVPDNEDAMRALAAAIAADRAKDLLQYAAGVCRQSQPAAHQRPTSRCLGA